jgi:hypothetical protein
MLRGLVLKPGGLMEISRGQRPRFPAPNESAPAGAADLTINNEGHIHANGLRTFRLFSRAPAGAQYNLMVAPGISSPANFHKPSGLLTGVSADLRYLHTPE